MQKTVNKIIIFLLLMIISLFLNNNVNAKEQTNEKRHRPDIRKLQFDEDGYLYIYADYKSLKNHFFPLPWDRIVNLNYVKSAYSGDSCVEIKFDTENMPDYYENYRTEDGRWKYFPGIQWVALVTSSGLMEFVYDISLAKRLTFWAKGQEKYKDVYFQVGGAGNYYTAYPFKTVSIGPIDITKEWEKYTIELDEIDLTFIAGGFMCVIDPNHNPSVIAIYLDEIRFEK